MGSYSAIKDCMRSVAAALVIGGVAAAQGDSQSGSQNSGGGDGCTMAVENLSGSGARFTVRLPG